MIRAVLGLLALVASFTIHADQASTCRPYGTDAVKCRNSDGTTSITRPYGTDATKTRTSDGKTTVCRPYGDGVRCRTN